MLKIGRIAVTQQYISEFDEIWWEDALWHPGGGRTINIWNRSAAAILNFVSRE